MVKRCILLVLVAGLLCLNEGGRAQDASTAKNRRTVYFVKHGLAKDLATVLGKHFKGDAEVQTLPESPSNCLLISAAPNVFEEIVKLLDQLDQQPQLVALDLLIAEVATKPGTGEQGLDEKELTGATRDVLSKVEALKKKGVFGSVRHIQLTAVENLPASVQIGEQKPYVTAITVSGGGVSKNITYKNVGAQLRVTAHVEADRTVRLDLEIAEMRLHVPEDGIVLGNDEQGVPIRATEFINSTLQSKLSVASGQALAAKGVKTESKSGQGQTLILVGAHVLGSEAKGNR